MEAPTQPSLAALAADARRELTEHILPYWMDRAVDHQRGGFLGRIDGHDCVEADAPKGGVLAARILWTFAAAAREIDDARYRPFADRAYGALRTHFRDAEHGGIFWAVTAEGEPLDTKKQVYAQAFAVYALAEYVRLTGDDEALAWAKELYALIEQHAVDPEHGGYLEAFSRNWGPIADIRLSEKDLDAPKSMNTHLHVLEAYTTLLRVWPDAGLAARLRDLVEIHLDRIYDAEAGHLVCFFETDWARASDVFSYGHDIEAAWLVDEAARAIGDADLQQRTAAFAVRVARTTLREGVDADGGLLNEATPRGLHDDDKHWWPQAEAVVGFLNAYEHSGDVAFADAASRTWDFIQSAIVDPKGGEWFFRVSREGVPYREEDKVGPWKCPYHNARACLEVIQRAGAAETFAPS